MVTLVDLTIIKDSPKKTKLIRMLEYEYKDCHNSDWLTKTMLTILNAAITQNRGVFILTRDSITSLLDKDTNHYAKVSLKYNSYKNLIKYLTNSLLEITKYKRFNRGVMVCEIVNPDVLKLIKADIDNQRSEVKLFVTGEVDPIIEQIQSIVNNYFEIKVTPIEQNKSFKVARKIKNIIEKYQKMK
jgi:hypothetical protein